MIPPNTSEHVVTAIETNEADGPALRRFAMEKLAEIESYDWCGIYRLEGDTLVLDEFVGAATDHSSIPVGRGVCGTAVAEGRNQIVEDVRERSNYLACSIQTRSEIVVLIRREGVVLGQIDVDGHRVGAFDSTDEQMLERVADRLAARW